MPLRISSDSDLMSKNAFPHHDHHAMPCLLIDFFFAAMLLAVSVHRLSEATSPSSSRDVDCAVPSMCMARLDYTMVMFQSIASFINFQNIQNHEDDCGHPGRSGFVHRSCDPFSSQPRFWKASRLDVKNLFGRLCPRLFGRRCLDGEAPTWN